MRPVALFALFLQLSQAALAAEPAPLVSAAELALNYSLPLVWTAPLPPTSLAYLNATASRSFLIDNWNLSSGTAASLSFVPNPVSAGVAGAEGLVLEVDYPVGTRVGAQFHMSPFEDFTSVQTAVLSYQVSPGPVDPLLCGTSWGGARIEEKAVRASRERGQSRQAGERTVWPEKEVAQELTTGLTAVGVQRGLWFRQGRQVARALRWRSGGSVYGRRAHAGVL